MTIHKKTKICQDSTMKLGQRIKEKREQLGFSQDKLARILNVTPQTVYRWEKGKAVPRPELLEKICRVFDTPLEWFYRSDDINQTETTDIPPDILEVMKNPKMQEFIRLVKPFILNKK